MSTQESNSIGRADLKSFSIELTNICNLHCSYCVRDDEQLHQTRAHFFPIELLRRIIRGARDSCGTNLVSFTGGEVTIHPQFAEIVEAVADERMQFSFVTNGWHFDRVVSTLTKHRAALNLVAFSLDGATREAHDRWRGNGSYVRVIRAITRCHVLGIPFILKVGIRRDTVPQLQDIALLAARLGANAVHFAHLMPTSSDDEQQLALSHEERLRAEQEIGVLGSILRMEVGVVTGYYNTNPAAPCESLSGRSCNVDYKGRLSLCCNLSGYRGAQGEFDVVADLSREEFGVAFARLQRVVEEQLERRRQALGRYAVINEQPDLYTGSPCLFCLQSFGKIPWRGENGTTPKSRHLPIVGSEVLAIA